MGSSPPARIRSGRGLICATSALAQATFEQPADRGFDVQRFDVAPGHDGFLTVDGAAAMPEGFGYSIGGLVGYQYKPLVVQSCNEVEDQTRCVDWKDDGVALVSHLISLDVLGAISFGQLFEAGLALPFVLYQTGETADQTRAGAVDPPSSHAGIS